MIYMRQVGGYLSDTLGKDDGKLSDTSGRLAVICQLNETG